MKKHYLYILFVNHSVAVENVPGHQCEAGAGICLFAVANAEQRQQQCAYHQQNFPSFPFHRQIVPSI